jgi:hypothetical protein
MAVFGHDCNFEIARIRSFSFRRAGSITRISVLSLLERQKTATEEGRGPKYSPI